MKRFLIKLRNVALIVMAILIVIGNMKRGIERSVNDLERDAQFYGQTFEDTNGNGTAVKADIVEVAGVYLGTTRETRELKDGKVVSVSYEFVKNENR